MGLLESGELGKKMGADAADAWGGLLEYSYGVGGVCVFFSG